MFIVSHSLEVRVNEIRRWRHNQPSVALLVAAAVSVYGLEKYKAFWRAELGHLAGAQLLTEVVTDWHAVTEAFDARNRLVHGRDRYTRKMATPHVEALNNGLTNT